MEETMGFVRRAQCTFALAGAAWLAVGGMPTLTGGMPTLCVGMAQAQDLAWGRRSCPPVQCPTPQEKPALEMPPALTPSPETPPSEPLLTPERAAAFEGETVALAVPNMLGDFLAPSCAMRTIQVPGQFTVIPGTPGTPGTAPIPPVLDRQGNVLIPGVPGQPAIPGTPPTFIPVFASFIVPSASHEFKIADNESPRPQDRFFSSFNYYNDVERDANSRIGADIGRINVYRQIIGFEKTFFDGNASIGMRLPFNLLDAPNSGTPSLGGTFADIGDLTVILKALLWENRDRGMLFSAGVAVTFPTGPDAFAGVGSVVGEFHNTLVQPYIGSIWTLNNLFVQGFSEIDIPTDSNDVTFWYDDFGIGYFLLRGRSGFITALAPTFEAHFNFPLSHRSGMCGVNIPDWVDLTEGFTVEFNRRATLAVGVSTPVTGPKPYDLEALAHFNIRF
jgi:hypothetical protein